ncbi:hypothetical protein QTP81_08610 [Alteromonas sp. ASW11-36]|uniref:Sel1 repeat family protein n=1 Tax=Alteromonas arenosi TaxID=3055817 RepID=A0ABT7SWX0_9ALTE|nr:hypothetical protein [Alteromonas sp. ASW11-36]MDM7860655.1 hypothetical protein [Alteromonas sp. ASW11-36]
MTVSIWARAAIILLLCSGIFASTSMLMHNQMPNDDISQYHAQLFKRFWHGDLEALAQLRASTLASADVYWLQQLADLDDIDSLLKLAELSSDENERIALLKRAANLGSSQGQFLWALEQRNPEQRIALFRQSAEQGYLRAQHALANWYLLKGSKDKAEQWLKLTASSYADDAFALADYYWVRGDERLAVEYFQQALSLGHPRAEKFLRVAEQGAMRLSEMSDTVLAFEPLVTNSPAIDCVMNILPIARSLANKVQAEQFVDQLRADRRLAQLPMCVSDAVWLNSEDFSCNMVRSSGTRRMRCDVHQLADLVTEQDVTHVVVFNPENRAYVDAGVMYLDLLDTYSVFVHELAHFAGFIDEYPMSKTLAQAHCAQRTAPNLLFSGDMFYEPLDRLDYWLGLMSQTTTNDAGIYPARTCNNVQQKAYKLVNSRTFMEFHDTNNIPDIYRRIWRDQIVKRAHWYPIAVNIARWHERADDLQTAQYWYSFAEAQAKAAPAQTIDAGIVDETYQPTSP